MSSMSLYKKLKEEYEDLFVELCLLLTNNKIIDIDNNFKRIDLNDNLGSFQTNQVNLHSHFLVSQKVCFYQNNKRNRQLIKTYFEKMDLLRKKIKDVFEKIYKRKAKYIREIEKPRIVEAGKKLKYSVLESVNKCEFSDNDFYEILKQEKHLKKHIYQDFQVNNEYRVSTNNQRVNVLSGVLIAVEVGERVKTTIRFKGIEKPEKSFYIGKNRLLMKESLYSTPHGKDIIQELRDIHMLNFGI